MTSNGDDDSNFLALSLNGQRQYMARCLGLGPNWSQDHMWARVFDILISVRKNDGLQSFYREIGRMKTSDL